MEPTSRPEYGSPSRRQLRQQRELKERRRRLCWWTKLVLGVFTLVFLISGGAVVIGFATPWGRSVRLSLAATIVSTRHYYLAHYITTEREYAALVKAMDSPVITTGIPTMVHVKEPTVSQVVYVNKISGDGFNGFVMLVHNPKLIRLVPAHVVNGEGEYITDMIQRVGAIAGTNASGFEDPKGEGWGGIPVGLEYVNGNTLSDTPGAQAWTTVGFTKDGVMVMGTYTADQLHQMGVRDAMQFHPELIVNGQPTITSGDGGWGYGPRTAMGQTKDGTVIFIVINGRFHGNSGMGASQRQVMDLMLQYGAVNACAMDGGSSSVLYADGGIQNSPSTIDPNGQRHLPDAWLVFPTEQQANLYPTS